MQITVLVFLFFGLNYWLQVQKEMTYNRYATDLPREKWHSWDPMLLSGMSFLTEKRNSFKSLKQFVKLILNKKNILILSNAIKKRVYLVRPTYSAR